MARGGRIERHHLPREIADGGGAGEAPPTLVAAARAFEREHLLRALRYCGGHRGETARVLGISRKTLWQKMREHRIQADEYGRGGSLTSPFGASDPAPRS
jgi:transcriptional regulator of acetoin/glycerol metabolism